MKQIGNVPEINEVKSHLEVLKTKQLITAWHVPYEEVLTRLTAAVFFLTPTDESKLDEIWQELGIHQRIQYQMNADKSLSPLEWRVEFNTSAE
ncbi:hypothetical protein HDE69_003555 [Pedobacter cryoconitis]|uniref:Uncharacterized protein n=1 Tax=Pedobacter cryoconitis TaxID=188932 RepID=A0A7W9DLS9_9SPHI|nr:hypothetical protein [Pedobacter cryoconitis]MBB5622480.1 hypothetical protein [Pedobacter cryoconitis]